MSIAIFGSISRAPAAVLTWTGAAGDENWFNPNNWTPTGLPTSSDTVNFSAGSCIVPASASFAVLNLNGADLGGTFSLRGTMNWGSGSLYAKMRVAPGGVLNIPGDAYRYLIGAITNQGTVVWSQTGSIYATETSLFYNQTNGVWQMEGDASYIWDSLTPTNALVINAGWMGKTGGTGSNIFSLGVTFTNVGTLEVQTGTVRFDDTFYNQGTNHVWTGGTLRMRGGGGGAGLFDVDPAGMADLGGGKFTFLPGLTVTGGGFFGVIGNVELHGVLAVNALGLRDGGNLSGAFTNAGTMDWTGGTLSGQLTVAPGGVLNITGDAFLIGTITNGGTVVWSNVANIYAAETSVLCNQTGGIWNIQQDATYIWNSLTTNNALVVNEGWMGKTGGTGSNTFSVGITFTNSGLLEVQTGTVRFDDLFFNQGTNHIWSGGTLRMRGGGGGAGLFAIDPGGSAYLGDGIFHWDPGLSVTGGGFFGIIGVVELHGVFAVDALGLGVGANLTGAFTNAGTMDWSAGTFSGQLTIGPGGVLNITGDAFLNGTITNQGTIVWGPAGNIYASETAVLDNQPGGIWEIQGDASYIWNSLTVIDTVIVNEGLVRKVAGPGTTLFTAGVSFSNSGTIEVQSGTLRFDDAYNTQGTNHVWTGATLFLNAGGTGQGLYNVDPGGAVNLVAGSFTFLPGLSMTGEGSLEILGNIELNGVLATSNLVLSTGGNLSGALTNAGTINWSGGTLSGQLTIAPGGVLNITGDVLRSLSGTITNQGTVNWNEAANIYATETSVFCNQTGGVWNIQGDATYFWDSLTTNNALVVNEGWMGKTGGTGSNTFTVGITFTNSGVVEVQTGTVRFDDLFFNQGTNHIWSGGTLRMRGGGGGAGLFAVDSGGSAYLGDGIFHWDPGLSVTGGGFFGVIGVVDLYGVLAVNNLGLSVGGNLGGAFTNAGTMDWSAGTLKGQLTVAHGGVLNITGDAYLIGTIANQGTVNWGSGNIYASETSVFLNQPGGVWEVQGDASYIWNSLTATNALVINAGWMGKIGGTGTNTFWYGVSFTNSGTVDVQTGTLWFQDGYYQLSSGTLVQTIAGIAPGQFGHLIAGAAALNGTLAISVGNGYQPQLGDNLSLITYTTRSGNFSTINGLALGGLFFTPFYGPNNFTLTAVPDEQALLGPVSLVTNSTFQFQVSGTPGQSYLIETSTNLVNWDPIYTNAIGGQFQLADTNVVAWPYRFYRAVTQP